MADVWVKQGDTAPDLQAVLRDGAGNPVDINGAAVTFHLRPIRDLTLTLSEPAENDQVDTGEDGSTGYVRYIWQEGDTDEAGGYYAEWEVIFQNQQVETFPNDGYTTVAIVPELDAVTP